MLEIDIIIKIMETLTVNIDINSEYRQWTLVDVVGIGVEHWYSLVVNIDSEHWLTVDIDSDRLYEVSVCLCAVFSLNRCFFLYIIPNDITSTPVSVLILRPREIQILWSQTLWNRVNQPNSRNSWR